MCTQFRNELISKIVPKPSKYKLMFSKFINTPKKASYSESILLTKCFLGQETVYQAQHCAKQVFHS